MSNPENLVLEVGMIFLIYVKDQNKLYAEYDIDEVVIEGSKYRLEPIYNSPEGLEMTDLMLLTLPSYDIATWKEYLGKELFPVIESDYFELLERLKN